MPSHKRQISEMFSSNLLLNRPIRLARKFLFSPFFFNDTEASVTAAITVTKYEVNFHDFFNVTRFEKFFNNKDNLMLRFCPPPESEYSITVSVVSGSLFFICSNEHEPTSWLPLVQVGHSGIDYSTIPRKNDIIESCVLKYSRFDYCQVKFLNVSLKFD